ncbi:MAG: response regulator, partial [Planctomycetota bacterium]
SRLLKLLGCTYEMAKDGIEGVDVVRKRHAEFDLVLMDGNMPRMDGFEASAAIRSLEARESWSRIPIMALTASALDADRRRALDSGMDSCLTKPISLEQLRVGLETVPPRGSQPPSAQSPRIQ